MKKRILVAPLNWGLGHATRCIPIINALIEHGFEPILASDGAALKLLEKEYPELLSIALPAYDVTYAKKGAFFKLKLFKDSPRLLKAIQQEHKATNAIVQTYNIAGIVSDNRLGVYSKTVPSAFITHQLNVLSGATTWLSTKIHNQFIRKFDACWVPDYAGDCNLSGVLGHPDAFKIPTTYLGPLSRFNKKHEDKKYDLLVLLSGPEPQRSILESKLLKDLQSFRGKVIFVRGIISEKQSKEVIDNIIIHNYMTSELLETAMNQSTMVLSRSGYTTIMDLAKLGKKAFFIPTPGQSEQEYLAKTLSLKHLAPSCKQNEFEISMLEEAHKYKGLFFEETDLNYGLLFQAFSRVKENSLPTPYSLST